MWVPDTPYEKHDDSNQSDQAQKPIGMQEDALDLEIPEEQRPPAVLAAVRRGRLHLSIVGGHPVLVHGADLLLDIAAAVRLQDGRRPFDDARLVPVAGAGAGAVDLQR